ncbi:MAG: nucleotide exchange factor GrpE [Verrucomicrobiota bacterium]
MSDKQTNKSQLKEEDKNLETSIENEAIEEEKNLEAPEVIEAKSSENEEIEKRVTPELSPEEKIAQLQDTVVRMRADFDNFRKRLQKEKEDSIRYANEGLLESLIPIFDNFELGLQAAEQATDVKSLVMGMSMVKEQLKRFLDDSGLTQIDARSGEFDPHVHEAVSHEESSDVPEGQIITQRRKGYKLKDRLIRPASVVVAKAPSEKEAEETSNTEQTNA